MRFSVVIGTFNRVSLLRRAIRSVLAQEEESEIIVVDDASSDETQRSYERNFRTFATYGRRKTQAPGLLETGAFREASGDWIVMLDDDDTLLPTALATVKERLRQFANSEDLLRFPVIQFANSGGKIPSDFLMVGLEELLNETREGEFSPVIQRKCFLKAGLAYPSSRVGAESLLWFKLASECPIPTWSDQIARHHIDAPIRLTSPHSQLKNAPELAEYQEALLSSYGELMLRSYPKEYIKRRLAAATYRILSESPAPARQHLRTVFAKKPLESSVLLALSFLDVRVSRFLFRKYRERQPHSLQSQEEPLAPHPS